MIHVVKIGLLFWVLSLCACTTVKDLDAPCTDFGKYCHQEPINVMGRIL